jgi:hypothetical protein
VTRGLLIRRLLLGILILWVLSAGALWLIAWRRLPVYLPESAIDLPVPLMTGLEYGEVIDTHPRPYVVEIESGAGGIVLYGAEHTRDPYDPQISDMSRRWTEFRPTVALVESRLGIMFPGFMDPVKTFAEPGAVHALAREDGIPTYSWEPPVEVRMRNLFDQGFSAEQIALYIVLGPYFSNRRFGRPEDPESLVAEAVRKRGDWPGIEGIFADVDAVEEAWTGYFPDGPDWREVSDQYGLPGFLGRIDGNAARDEHFVRVIIDLVRQGERVFAVAGSSHAVKLDAALRAALGS